MFDSSSPFDFRPPSFTSTVSALLSAAGELILWSSYYLIFSEVIDLGGAYLSQLPLLGMIFDGGDSDVSDLLCILLASYSTLVPLVIWSEFLDKKVYLSPREYFSEPLHRVIWGIYLFLLFAAIAIECFALFELVQKSTETRSGFVDKGQLDGMIGWLSEHHSFAEK